MSILKLFVDNFVSFLKREVIIICLWIENIAVLEKMEKKESVIVVQ